MSSTYSVSYIHPASRAVVHDWFHSDPSQLLRELTRVRRRQPFRELPIIEASKTNLWQIRVALHLSTGTSRYVEIAVCMFDMTNVGDLAIRLVLICDLFCRQFFGHRCRPECTIVVNFDF